MDAPPAPSTRYNLRADNALRFEVVRVLQGHPEYWVLELRGLYLTRLRVEVLVLREAAYRLTSGVQIRLHVLDEGAGAHGLSRETERVVALALHRPGLLGGVGHPVVGDLECTGGVIGQVQGQSGFAFAYGRREGAGAPRTWPGLVVGGGG